MTTAPLVPLVLAACLAACSSGPPLADWRLNTQSASTRATDAYLVGQLRVADSEWARAAQEAARSARAEEVARVLLAQCAAQVASLVFDPCVGLAPLQPDTSPALQAYERYLAAKWQAADVALLPATQQPLARVLLSTQVVGPSGGGEAQAVLQSMADPLSRLMGAAVVLRAGQASPQTVALAVSTASEQGWTRPLLAWLGVQAQWAEQAGDADTAQRARRRMDLLAPAAPR